MSDPVVSPVQGEAAYCPRDHGCSLPAGHELFRAKAALAAVRETVSYLNPHARIRLEIDAVLAAAEQPEPTPEQS